MARMTNCKICGQLCEEDLGYGVFGLIFGFPIHPRNLCCDRCYREWHGPGRIWYGARWRKQAKITLIVLAVIAVVVGVIVIVTKCFS